MANHLDLEEQEQLDQLKHFWNSWGVIIGSILLVIFGSVAIWSGYQFWQNSQALQAAFLLDAVENAVQVNDETRLEQAFTDIRKKYSSTTQAGQAGLMVAKFEIEKGNFNAGQAALEWVSVHSSDEGYKALANLRLADIMIDRKSYDSALQYLSNKFAIEFDAIVADRKGNIFSLKNKKQEAISEYTRAYASLSDGTDYRRLLEVKLSAFGLQPKILADLTTTEAIK